jgi:hypothetical protein
MLPAMFVVSEETATAIRTLFEQEGELSAAIEVRRCRTAGGRSKLTGRRTWRGAPKMEELSMRKLKVAM